MVTPNNIGVNGLTVSSGVTTTPGGTPIDYVEYTLRFADSTKRWQHNASYSGGVWKTAAEAPTDIWNRACDDVVGCGAAGGSWAVWKSSNIAWVESTNYVFAVRARDTAGNFASTVEISFNYDIARPVSKVTSPAQNTALTSRIATITGTAEDQISTGTPSGLSADFWLAIQRVSDSYWWCDRTLGCTDPVTAVSSWTPNAAGAVYQSSMPVSLGTGLGLKTWSLSLSSTFYDLLADTATFRVYTWARDQVNNPASAVNIESSTTVKLVFSYRSSTPTLTAISPVASTATNTQGSVVLNLDPVGGRITQVWVAFLDTSTLYWTMGSSWSANATSDPPPVNSDVWLSTNNQVAGAPTPDMSFALGTTPDGLSPLTITLSSGLASGTTVQMPNWQSGTKYKVYVKAVNTAGQVLNTALAVTTHVFVFDTTSPTMTAHAAITSLSSHSAVLTEVNSLTIASGTVADNVSDSLDYRKIYFRLFNVSTSKYLNPSTLIAFDKDDGNVAWSGIDTTTNAWSYDLSLAQFINGNQYKLELYAQDGAGNNQASARASQTVGCPVYLNTDTLCQTGSVGNPKYVRYFRYNKLVPTVAITSPTVVTPNNIGVNGLTVSSGVTTTPGGT
ncbi:MAG: hypothetical protein AAB263_19785, partial [Planctomycetota bacterium]